jgi:hypothetical protein
MYPIPGSADSRFMEQLRHCHSYRTCYIRWVHGVAAGTAFISFTNMAGLLFNKRSYRFCMSFKRHEPGTTAVTNLNGDGNVNISLYPNPTKGTFSVNTPEAGTLSISTIEGREVMKHEVKAGITELDLPSSIVTGVYMCRFVGIDGSTTTVRLIYEQN